jgi:saccharopine dehydrogenase-like NADP-dependent oxidoreductase
VQGRAAIVYLLEQKDVSEIVATDIRLQVLQEFSAGLKDSRGTIKYLDLSDYDESVKTLKGFDVVVNCAITLGGHLKTTKAALEAGTNYLDLTTKGERDAQRTLDEEFRRKGLVCVQDMGVASGLTSISDGRRWLCCKVTLCVERR